MFVSFNCDKFAAVSYRKENNQLHINNKDSQVYLYLSPEGLVKLRDVLNEAIDGNQVPDQQESGGEDTVREDDRQ